MFEILLNCLFNVKKRFKIFRSFTIFITSNERRELFHVFTLVKFYKSFEMKNALFKLYYKSRKKNIVVETRRFEIAQSYSFTDKNCDRFSMMLKHFFDQ